MFHRLKWQKDSGRGYGLMLVALLVVLVPSICLVWLMNRALQNERVAVNQKLVEAYRGHLTLAQERLDRRVRSLSEEFERAATNLSPAQLFAREAAAGRADAVICFDSANRVVYPVSAQVKAPLANDQWNEAERLELSDPAAAARTYELIGKSGQPDLAAQAFQAQARCLLRAGNAPTAAAVWEELSTNNRFGNASDTQGRLIAPAATLMLLNANEGSSSNRQILSERLARQIDYTNAAMPSSQRRFLLRELVKYRAEPAWKVLLAAEDLSARLIESGPLTAATPSGEPGFRSGPQTGLWQFTSEHGLVATFHYSTNLAGWLGKSISPEEMSSDVALLLQPPGIEREKSLAAVPAGPTLPGWNLAVALTQSGTLTGLTQQGVASYLWIGTLALVMAGILAALMMHLVRRQLALNRLRTDLVANVTHELKTPLSSMRLLVDTLLQSAKPNEPAAREYLELIAQENQRLSRLIDNFLTFSRIERNKYQFTFQTIDAATIVENAAQAVRERFNVPGCRFEVQKTAPGASFVGDGDAIVTALVNLLDNAWKYSGDEKSIALGAATEKGNVIFSVRDNGEGIPSRDLKKIFKRFYQVDQRLSRNGGGCGLGLSIVQFIMRAHKGTVEVDSQPGGGSMFRLILPAAQINRDRDDSDEATAVSNVNGSSMERSGSQAEEAVRK